MKTVYNEFDVDGRLTGQYMEYGNAPTTLRRVAFVFDNNDNIIYDAHDAHISYPRKNQWRVEYASGFVAFEYRIDALVEIVHKYVIDNIIHMPTCKLVFGNGVDVLGFGNGRCRICGKPCPFDHDVPADEIVCDMCSGATGDNVNW